MFRPAVRWVTAMGIAVATTLPAVSPALAQPFGIATLTHADGGVTRLHGGAPAATTINVSIMDDDTIATTNGRAEIGFPDGSLIHLDRNSKLVVHAGERVETVAGRISLRISGVKGYVAETATSKVHIQISSVVEINAGERGDVRLRVINGTARMETPSGTSQVPDYHTAYVAGPASAPAVTKVVPTLADEFERWALSRVVMATSTPLPGSEHGGGIYYGSYYGPYYASAYAYPYAYPWYPTSAYYPVYYSGPSYYVAPVYTSRYYVAPSASYYHSAPVRSYYGGYSSYYGGTYYGSHNGTSYYSSPSLQRYSSPSSSSQTPSTFSAPSPAATGAVRGVAIPKL